MIVNYNWDDAFVNDSQYCFWKQEIVLQLLITMSARKPNTTNRFIDFEEMWEEKDHENEKKKKSDEKKKK